MLARRLPESTVLSAVADVCRLLGVEIERQNTGGRTNDRGQYVPFGRPGNSDLTGMTGPAWGERKGLKVDIECKREGFEPRRCYGKARERWEKQLDRLRRTNANGGFGFWADSPEHAMEVLRLLKTGYRVRIDDDEDSLVYWPEDDP